VEKMNMRELSFDELDLASGAATWQGYVAAMGAGAIAGALGGAAIGGIGAGPGALGGALLGGITYGLTDAFETMLE
jgi:hypothetical protein